MAYAFVHHTPTARRRHTCNYYGFQTRVLILNNHWRLGSSSEQPTTELSSTNGPTPTPPQQNVRTDSPIAQPFGKQEYWESFYNSQSETENDNFSWYSSWEDMEPFVREYMPPNNDTASTVLVPGIGSDAALLQSLYESGYTPLAAFDYAPSSIQHCQRQLAQWGLPSSSLSNATIDLCVADATETLPYPPESVRLVIDKGTFDSIFIAGGRDRNQKRDLLSRAVQQIQRVVAPGGIIWSLSGICTATLRDLEDCWDGDDARWQVLADTTTDTLITTSDGYTSNNLDGDLLVWRKLPHSSIST